MEQRVIFHIGLEKTGTKSFQQFCAAHRGALARQGVLYPRFRARRRPDHAILAATYLHDHDQPRDYALTKIWIQREDALAAVRREIAGSGAKTVLFSAEHFSSRFDHDRARQLARDFGDYKPRIVIVLRDPYARFLSAYSTSIVSGRTLSLDAYADEVFHPANPYLDIARTMAPWQEAFGADRMTLIDYNGEDDIVAAVLRACGIQPHTLGRLAAPRSNVSLRPDVVRALQLCNLMLRQRQGHPDPASFPPWYQHMFFSKACRRVLRRDAGPSTSRSWSITASTLAHLDRIAETERQWLIDHGGIAVRGGTTRQRMVVRDGSDAPSEAELLLARCLVDRVTRGLWSLSQMAVSAALAFGRGP